MRLRRFLRDWELFREREWPMIRFEDFLADPRHALRVACLQLGLEWDDSMLSWPKRLSDIAYPSPRPNATFVRHRREGGVGASLARGAEAIDVSVLPRAELVWLEETFGAYNAFHDYPPHLQPASEALAPAPALHERILRAEQLAEHDA